MHMSRKILCIDDNQSLLRLVHFMLTKVGYQVSTAETGNLGLFLAHQEKPDLILLDIILPDINGYSLCQQLRRQATFDNIPIVMLTALGQEEDFELSAECGADDHIIKPFTSGKLVSLLNRKLNVMPRSLNGVDFWAAPQIIA